MDISLPMIIFVFIIYYVVGGRVAWIQIFILNFLFEEKNCHLYSLSKRNCILYVFMHFTKRVGLERPLEKH